MYAFGYGLSYTEFSYKDLRVTADDTITATFKVTNTGNRAGVDVPQIYLTEAAGDKRIRLLGFERVQLKPGESREISIMTDPRLLARFDGAKNSNGVSTKELMLSRCRAQPITPWKRNQLRSKDA